jgi:ubiquinone/menaquinone biosynthesis C-methylase UbiE
LKRNYHTLFYKKEIKHEIAYPAESVIRIFKGNFPKLNFKFKKKQKILDVGFGDGRHLVFFKKLGLKVYGTEVTKDIIKITKKKLKIKNLAVGTSLSLPYKDSFFDILITWNSCYYMGYRNFNANFKKVPKELSRVLKKNAYIIISVPTLKCFIFNKSSYPPKFFYKKLIKNYRIIKNDYFKYRNGEVMRCFLNKKDLKKEFTKYFKNLSFSSIKIDCFGLNYDWIVMVGQKK